MPPASRGFKPKFRFNFVNQPVRHFHSRPCLRQGYRNPRGHGYGQAQEPLMKPILTKGAISQLFARIWTPFRFVAHQITRIPAPYRRFIGNVLKFLSIVSVAFIHFRYQIMYTNGSSMAPFLNPNNAPHLPESKDKLLVQRLARVGVTLSGKQDETNSSRPLQRGEIVVFWTPHDPTKVAVKRIVGVPGDKVTPLKGFEGPNEVVVQYNHLWVEGDVDDREKSRDSNWYGQISQNLVIGRVVAVLEPLWRPRVLNVSEHDYPAKRKRRVVENAVAGERVDLAKREEMQAWANGRADLLLDQLTGSRSRVIGGLMTKPSDRKRAAKIYSEALEEAMRNNPETREKTASVLEILAGIFRETGFQPVIDEKRHADLQPTPDAPQKMTEWKMRSVQEDDPEEAIRRSREISETNFAKAEQEIASYDEWSWFSKYTPKSVLAAGLAKRKKDYEEKHSAMERELAEIKAQERLDNSHVTLPLTVQDK